MIVVVEELVDESVIRADPNRTLIPGLIVDAVVVEPWGAHPSYAQGYLRPRQRVLCRVGGDLAGSGRRSAAIWTNGCYGVRDRAEYVARSGRAAEPPARADAPVCAGGSNYGVSEPAMLRCQRDLAARDA